jgi:hypothetical protein
MSKFVGRQRELDELNQVLAQARAGRLPFVPEIVGSRWAQDVQVDVVALNWREQALLLSECKWGVDPVGRSVVRELVEEKTPKVLQALPNARGKCWRSTPSAGWSLRNA